ncbi:MAG TPA: iron-sulfur cluster assembly accessory protein [Cytophagaceae bacterium]|jgi:iron-sulfur cluster assembly protein
MDLKKPLLPLPCSLTEQALSEIKSIIANKNIPTNYGLRIGTKGGGCAGVSYIIGFDLKKDTDKEYFVEGINIYVDKSQAMFLFGLEISFEETSEGRGFVFNS